MSLVSKDSIIQACADAYKEGAGVESVKVGELASAILAAISAGGGSLPEGWAVGEFTATEETREGNFKISHGLGVIPNYIIIWAENEDIVYNQWRMLFKVNLSIVYDEVEGKMVPTFSIVKGMYDTSASMTNSSASYDFDDDTQDFWVPYYGSRFYNPDTTYRWLAVALGK